MTNPTIDWDAIHDLLSVLGHEVYEQVADLPDAIIGTGASGDILSKRDDAAVELIRTRLSKSSPYPCALIDESSAELVPLHDNPIVGYIADPIDGTRPALMGMPIFTTCLAAFPLKPRPTLKDVTTSVIQCMDGDRFSFVRGQGVFRKGKRWTASMPEPVSLNSKARVHFDFAGGIPSLAHEYIAELSQSYLNGYMVLNASGYSATRLLTGGIHTDIHIGARIFNNWPELRNIVSAVNGTRSGILNGSNIWDVAPTMPLLQEAGFVATWSDGRSLDDAALDDKPPLTGYHYVAAAKDFHAKVVNSINRQEALLLAQKKDVIKHIRSVHHFAP